MSEWLIEKKKIWGGFAWKSVFINLGGEIKELIWDAIASKLSLDCLVTMIDQTNIVQKIWKLISKGPINWEFVSLRHMKRV